MCIIVCHACVNVLALYIYSPVESHARCDAFECIFGSNQLCVLIPGTGASIWVLVYFLNGPGQPTCYHNDADDLLSVAYLVTSNCHAHSGTPSPSPRIVRCIFGLNEKNNTLETIWIRKRLNCIFVPLFRLLLVFCLSSLISWSVCAVWLSFSFHYFILYRSGRIG